MIVPRSSAARLHPRGSGNRFPVSAGGLLTRIVGMTVWRIARAESLPVPPLRGEGSSSVPSLTGMRLMAALALRAVSVAATIAAVCAIVIGAIAFDRLRSIRSNLLDNPEGDTLLQQADRLQNSLDGAWWVRFYPGYPDRIARMAREIREGRSALVDAAVAYGDSREALASLGLPARLVRGAEIVTPLKDAIERISTQFHRETVTYLQIEAETRPYLRSEQNRAVLTGVLSSCPSGHALLIAGLDREGITKWRTPDPVQNGKEFRLDLRAVATVRLTDLFKPPGAASWQVVESVDIPFETWADGPVPFAAADSRFKVKFAQEKEAQAPRLAKLSLYARAAIAPLPSTLRGG